MLDKSSDTGPPTEAFSEWEELKAAMLHKFFTQKKHMAPHDMKVFRKIAKVLPCRSPEEVRRYYFAVLEPKEKKGKAEEKEEQEKEKKEENKAEVGTEAEREVATVTRIEVTRTGEEAVAEAEEANNGGEATTVTVTVAKEETATAEEGEKNGENGNAQDSNDNAQESNDNAQDSKDNAQESRDGIQDAKAAANDAKDDFVLLDAAEASDAAAGQAPPGDRGLFMELVKSALKLAEGLDGRAAEEAAVQDQGAPLTGAAGRSSVFVKRPAPNTDSGNEGGSARIRRKAARIVESEEEQQQQQRRRPRKKSVGRKSGKNHDDDDDDGSDDNGNDNALAATPESAPVSLPERALSTLMELTGMDRNAVLYALLYSSGDIRIAHEYLMGRGRLPWDAESDRAVSQGSAGRMAKTLEEIVERASFLCELSEP